MVMDLNETIRVSDKSGQESVIVADSFVQRLKGLLGTRKDFMQEKELYIRNCRCIHTIGMRYSIDVAFLDKAGSVNRIKRNVRPCRIVCGPMQCVDTVERPAKDGAWLKDGQVYGLEHFEKRGL